MLQSIEMPRDDMVGFEAKGKVTAEDYQSILHPLVDDARAQGRRIRFLFHLGRDFEGFTAGAGWEDFKLGFRHMRTFERCAVVTDVDWVAHASRFFGAMIPCPVKVFANAAIDEAKHWLASDEGRLSHALDESTGVMTVEISHPLSSEDFEDLTNAVDDLLERGGRLQGLVIHARKFPGWENLGSLISHIEFVKNHHRKIRRVALCADGTLPSLAPQVAKHFVAAEIQHFDYDRLDEARTWAATPRQT